MNKQVFLNTKVNNVDLKETIEFIENCILKQRKSYIIPINVDVVMKIENDTYLKKIVDNADLTLIDGKPLIWISKLKKDPIKEKISGSDLVPKLCEISANKGYKIFIMGGKDGVAEQAKKNLERKYNKIKIVGTYAPPVGFEKNKEELDKINNMINVAKPDLLFVCLGCPKQEKWVYDNLKKNNATVCVCAGATVDFLAGNIKRAPKWMSNVGLEWFYRFLKEPKRLFKRYFIDDVKIIKLIFKYK